MNHPTRHFLLKALFLVSGTAISLGLSDTLRADEQSMQCMVYYVTSYQERVHLRCKENVEGINFFAVPTSDPHWAARVLDIGLAAVTSKRWVIIGFDLDDTSGTSFGCQANDCRVIHSID